MRKFSSKVTPKSNDEVLIRRKEAQTYRHTEETPYEDEGKIWSDVSTSQEIPKIATLNIS